jgi:hypothetical protein
MNNHALTAPGIISVLILASSVLLNPLAFGADNLPRTANGDPADWYHEDTTPLAQFRNSKKENLAALKEALLLCKALPKPEQARCAKDARQICEQDIASARQRNGVREK